MILKITQHMMMPTISNIEGGAKINFFGSKLKKLQYKYIFLFKIYIYIYIIIRIILKKFPTIEERWPPAVLWFHP
jgi:hypothetical protein